MSTQKERLNQRYAEYSANPTATTEDALAAEMFIFAKKAVKATMKDLANQETVEDVATDSVMDVLKNIRAGAFKRQSLFSSYLFEIAKRKAYRQMIDSLDAKHKFEEFDSQVHDSIDEKTLNPEERAMQNEQCSRVVDALNVLTEEERSVARQKSEGRSAKQIATSLGINEARVAYVYKLAKEKLRRELESNSAEKPYSITPRPQTPSANLFAKGAKENAYPRPASEAAMKGEWPRPACSHDPAGLLATCDICGPDRNGEARKATA